MARSESLSGCSRSPSEQSVRYARVIAKHEEQLDAIGSRRNATEVEPAAWKISLVFLQMVLFVVFGLYLLVTAAL